MREPISAHLLKVLLAKIERLSQSLEKAAIAEYVELFRNPLRLLYLNFLAGVFRGFGIAVGFTIVGAVFLVLLGRLAALNLPLIGDFIADIVRVVQEQLAAR